MYKGKYSRERRRRPALWAALALALVLTLTAGGTVAYLFTNTDAVTNTFTPAKTSIDVPEEFDGKVKKNVTVQNTGDIDVYIRAMIVVTWQDKDGNVYATAPVKGTDYTISLGNNTGWTAGADGYYYYGSALKPSASTGKLIDTCKPVAGREPKDYTLVVDVLAQAIQTEPDSVVGAAWSNNKVTVTGNNGTLTVEPKTETN